jgi:RNA methyltransferase, TrmH family
MIAITSPNNPKFKSALRLDSSRGRKQQGRFPIHGVRELLRAFTAALEFTEVFVCQDLLNRADLAVIEETCLQKSVPCFALSLDLFRRLAYGDRQDGVVAIAVRPEVSLGQLKLPAKSSFVMVVEGIEKPGNLGAVARSADGAGAAALISANPQTDFYHPNSIRASLGTVLTIPVAEGSSTEVFEWLQANQFQIYAAIVGAEKVLWEVSFASRIAIVLGNEASGLGPTWMKKAVTGISLPMKGVADSLNISNTAAIVAYEVARQRFVQARDVGRAN